jgi:membrane-bound lytic murein transglycosylase C
MTLTQACAEDPLCTRFEQALQAEDLQLRVSGQEAATPPKEVATPKEAEAEAAAGSEEWVFPELFSSLPPSPLTIRQKAAQLMKHARIRYGLLSASTGVLPVGTARHLTAVIPLPDERIEQKARAYAPTVATYAAEFGLSEAVVMAIIHTESFFNPLARSHIPAFGLMQIVPGTAGKDAARLIYKRPRLFSSKFLFNPQNNIRVGSAYLHVLYYQYLDEITHPESRLYYTLAAYNGGIANVARAFVDRASFQEAVPIINQMSPDEVMTALMERAPTEQTRQYLQKVLRRKRFYQDS